jgi:hypothetical protein
MANRMLTRDEVRKEIVEPVTARLKAHVAAILAEMKPGETRTIPNPFGRDLIPLTITKPLAAKPA